MNLKKIKDSLRVKDMEEGDWSHYPDLTGNWTAPRRPGQTLGLSWPKRKATVKMTFLGEDYDGDPSWNVELVTANGHTEFDLGGQELDHFEDVLEERLKDIEG